RDEDGGRLQHERHRAPRRSFPGGHIGLTEDPRAFAARLRDVLLAP
ncbi:hypothetical protein I3W98_04810, partial [Streptomyces cavourensis]|nr:hypothetical protein [Streptomyces cavourensis]